ncbi:MAG: patatin-like phospholipase family protein [Bacteroidaceae bacterium]|nr:patatin-like phospholipase family protein [Bacteroidaceae bacterium]
MRNRVIILLLAALPLMGWAQQNDTTKHTAEARPKVGLVLGGGGAKGAAEVGVLKVIERAGIPIDYIVGTSIGSIVGGLYATGYRAEEMDSIFRAQTWLSLLTDRREEYTIYPYKRDDGITYVFGFPVYVDDNGKQGAAGALYGRKIEQMLDSLMGMRGFNEFESLKIPFRCVACDFRNVREVVLHDGFPALAMRASMAIPGVFKPVVWKGVQLVDGGMVNNLPVDVCRAMGADIVIAIDLQQSELQERTKDFGFVERMADWVGVGNLVKWATRRPDISKNKKNSKAADIYIHPVLADYDASSFKHESVEVMLQLGENEGRRHWDELVALKRKLSPGIKIVTKAVKRVDH